MDNVLDKNFSKAFAIAWNENQGGYSEGIAKKTLNFAKNQGLKINTVLDICCGSANFLNEMHNSGKICTGTEILDSYIEYNKQKFPNISFHSFSFKFLSINIYYIKFFVKFYINIVRQFHIVSFPIRHFQLQNLCRWIEPQEFRRPLLRQVIRHDEHTLLA